MLDFRYGTDKTWYFHQVGGVQVLRPGLRSMRYSYSAKSGGTEIDLLLQELPAINHSRAISWAGSYQSEDLAAV